MSFLYLQIHATKTEEYLTGKDLADVNVLQAALAILHDELQPEDRLDEADPEYKKTLGVNLFYKVQFYRQTSWFSS